MNIQKEKKAVILSIKPEFAFKIFAGTKKFEFRKSLFKHSYINKVIVYVSSPVKRIMGEFEIEHILSHEPETLWRITKKHSGISEDFFFEYFADKAIGHAIKIKKIRKYRKSLCIRENFNAIPPQSFVYVV